MEFQRNEETSSQYFEMDIFFYGKSGIPRTNILNGALKMLRKGDLP